MEPAIRLWLLVNLWELLPNMRDDDLGVNGSMREATYWAWRHDYVRDWILLAPEVDFIDSVVSPFILFIRPYEVSQYNKGGII